MLFSSQGIKRSCSCKRPRRLLESFKSFVVVFTGSWKNVQPMPMAFEIVYLPAQVGKAVQDPWAGIQEQEIYRMCIELLRSLIHFLMSRQDTYNCAPISKTAFILVEEHIGSINNIYQGGECKRRKGNKL